MPEYSLAASTIRVRRRSDPATSNTYLSLSDFDFSGGDVLQFIYEFCNAASRKPVKDKSKEKYLQSSKLEAEGRIVRATIEAGSYGSRAQLRDIETQIDTYTRTESDAELLPLRNLFAIPEDSSTGLFITERIGIHGCKTSLVGALRRSFNFRYPNYILEINSLAPEEAVKASLDEGDLKKIRLIRYGIPSDVADRYKLGLHESQVGGTIELVLTPGRGFSFPKYRLSNALRSDDRAGLLEIRGMDYHDIKLEVRVGKSIRTLTVTNTKPPRVTFPVPTDAGEDPGGRPSDEGLYSFAVEVIHDFARDIGFPVERLHGIDFSWSEEMLLRTTEIIDVED